MSSTDPPANASAANETTPQTTMEDSAPDPDEDDLDDLDGKH